MSTLSLLFMSTYSSATFLDCQSTSEMYCLDLGRSFGLFFFMHSNKVLGFPGYPRLTPVIILVVRPKRRRISHFIFKIYRFECHL